LQQASRRRLDEIDNYRTIRQTKGSESNRAEEATFHAPHLSQKHPGKNNKV
jgi:hypothetical protein